MVCYRFSAFNIYYLTVVESVMNRQHISTNLKYRLTAVRPFVITVALYSMGFYTRALDVAVCIIHLLLI